jgi:hypothetical protein
MEIELTSISESVQLLNKRAEWHLNQLKRFNKASRNYKYHAYMRKTILDAVKSLDNARFSLPQDFA